MGEPILNFERNLGSDGSHGIKFEWDMTLLTYLRCEELHEEWKTNKDTGIKSFFVANNVKGVGSFDDIVVRVEHILEGEDKTKLIFVQCKHVEGDSTNRSKFLNYLGRKEIQKYFNSFVKVYNILDNDSTLCNNPEEVEQKQADSNLKELFNCKWLDCEFLFLSNISSEPRDYFEKNINSISEITAKLFTGQQNIENEFSLIPDKCYDFLSLHERFSDEEKKKLISEFCKRFRLFLHQNDKLDNLIESAMSKCKGEKINDVETIRIAMLDETKIIFESNPKFSTVLNENTDMLNKTACFVELKKTSKDFLHSYHKKLYLISPDVCDEISNDSIKIKTQFPRFQKLKIYQSFIEISKQYLCIILRHEADIQKFAFARETCVYKNENKVYIFLETSLEFSRSKLENEFFVQIEKIVDCHTLSSPLVQELVSDTISAIECYNICFQGNDMKLGEFCSNWRNVISEHSLCDILEATILTVGKKLPPKPSCYVKRKFQIKSLSEKMTKLLEQNIQPGDKNMFLIFHEPNKNIKGFSTSIKVFETKEEAKKQFAEILKEKIGTVHICSYINKELKLLYKVGQMCNCVENTIVDEDDLAHRFDHCKRVTILTDVAGMGKSTSMLVLANKYKEMNQSHWVFFIELSKHVFETAENFQNPVSAISFVASRVLKLEGMDYDLFVDACKEIGNVALFFDGFDEISSKEEKIISQLLLALNETKIAGIFVSSRPKCVEVLENAFLQQSMQFVEFSSEEEENCLMSTWKEMLGIKQERIDIEQLNNIVNKIIRSMQCKENLLNRILAIPFQIRMIAKAYYQTMLQILKSEISMNDIQVDIVNLYENFINSYVKHFFTEKMEWKFEKLEKSKQDRYIREKLRGSEELACSILVPKLLDSESKYRSDIFAALFDDLGLITNEKPPIFLHRTIGEYLAAKYIVNVNLFTQQNSKRTVRMIESIFVKDKYEVLRMFVNSLLFVDKLPIYFNSFKENDTLVSSKYHRKFPLHIAASEGNVTLLKALYARDRTLANYSNENGQSVLHLACECGDVDAVRFLLLKNPNCVAELIEEGQEGHNFVHCAQMCLVNSIDSRNNNVFHYAALNGKVEIIKLILEHITLSKASSFELQRTDFHFSSNEVITLLNMRNANDLTPLHFAVLQNKIQVVELLMKQPNCKINNFSCEDGFLLHKAAENGCNEIVKILLERDEHMINMTNIHGDTPLHCAISFGNIDTFKLLLQQKNCSTGYLNNDCETVLHVAAEKNCIEIIEILLERDKTLVNIQNIDGVTPLYLASCSGKVGAVKLLLKYKDCLINLRNKKNETALHVSASKGFYEIITAILQHDRSVINLQNNDGLTALHIASRSGKFEAAKALLQYPECSKSLLDKHNETVLHKAAENGNIDIMLLLIEQDTSLLNMKDLFGRTPLHCACEFDNFNAVEILIRSGCSLNETDVHGNTIFHISTKKNEVKIMEMILQHDTSLLNLQNNKGETPMHLACSCGNIDGVKFLLERDCSINERNYENKTALQCASKVHKKVIEGLYKDKLRSSSQKNCTVS